MTLCVQIGEVCGSTLFFAVCGSTLFFQRSADRYCCCGLRIDIVFQWSADQHCFCICGHCCIDWPWTLQCVVRLKKAMDDLCWRKSRRDLLEVKYDFRLKWSVDQCGLRHGV